MKKTLKVLCTILALCFMMSFASAAEMGSAEDEANATAGYVMNTLLADAVSADTYSAGYNDVINAMLCMKVGVSNEDVLSVIDEQIKAQISNTEAEKYLGAKKTANTYPIAIAATALYMQERKLEIEKIDILAMVEDAYLNVAMNPYGLQYIASLVESNPDYDWTEVEKKLTSDVKGYLGKSGDYNIMALWGNASWAMADDQGQTIVAVLHVAKNDAEVAAAVQDMVEWTATQVGENGAVGTNSNSTALACKLFALAGNEDMANKCFAALSQFKNNDTEGGYNYNGKLSGSSTIDCLSAIRAMVAMDADEPFFAVQSSKEPDPTPTPTEDPTPTPTEDPTDTPTPSPETPNGEKPTDVPNNADTPTPSAVTNDYKIIAGQDAKWDANEGKELVISSNADFSLFVKVLMDGQEVAASNYTAVSGSTKITFKTEYLKTLKSGTHVVTIVSKDGEAKTTITVKAMSDKTPETGDSTPLVFYVVGMALMMGVLVNARKERA